jgi:hypothetical protein
VELVLVVVLEEGVVVTVTVTCVDVLVVVDDVLDVLVVAACTAKVALPELGALFASPGYEAVTVTLPAVAPVAVTEHVPPAVSVQLAGDGKVAVPVLPEA